MKKNDHVQFTGKLPKELKKTNKPIYGTVVKMIGKSKAEVKPRYKRFTVSVLLTDLTKVADNVFTKPQKKAPKKIVVTAPKKLKAAVVKAAAEVKNKEPFRPSPETIAKVSKAESVEETKAILKDAHVPVEKCDPPKPKFPLNEESLKDFAKEEEEEKPYNWVQEKPVNETPEAKIPYLEEEHTSNGGAVIWGVIAIIVAVCVGAYFLFF